MLSRDDVRKKLTEWGIENPTDEQVGDYLAQISKEIKASEDKALRYKADSDRVKDLQKQLDTLNNQNMTEVEKANKATEDALKQVDALQKTVMQMQRAKELAEIGIVGDDAEGLFSDDGSLNVSKLGEIINGREKSAVANFEKDAMAKTPNPEGGNPDTEDEGDPIVKDVVKSVAESVKARADAVSIIDSYK